MIVKSVRISHTVAGMRASLVENDHDHRCFDVMYRVSDDGVGFGYDVPAQHALRARH